MKYLKPTGIACLLVSIALAFWLWKDNDPVILPDQKRLNHLQMEKDSIIQQNQKLDQEYEQLKIQSDSILLLLQNDHQVIQHLNQQKNEKIRAIDHYDRHELYQFFTNYQLTTPSPSNEE